MRRIAVALVVSMVVGAVLAGSVLAQPAPEFKLGFKVLAGLIPDVAGQPLEEEHYGPNGDSLQQTTTGLMVWRKADNWTAFTDGATTWINGPNGLESRLNTERLGWEQGAPSFTLEELRNAEYQVGTQRFRLVDGKASLQPTGSAVLLEQWVAFGDLDYEDEPDAAVVLVTQPGGSGSFYYLVAMLGREGSPVQGAITLLGDRVKIQELSIADGLVRVRMLTQGPGDPMINPTLLVEQKYRLWGGGFVLSN